MLLIVGLIVRLVLLIFGLWQDAHLRVKYTDIDYEVYTDAARFVAGGRSPYERSTYRYSPLLAFLMVPNVVMHKAWGKHLFCAADLLAARLVFVELSAPTCTVHHLLQSAVAWLTAALRSPGYSRCCWPGTGCRAGCGAFVWRSGSSTLCQSPSPRGAAERRSPHACCWHCCSS